jgi:transcriptional regulator GlxA family with amidase domain
MRRALFTLAVLIIAVAIGYTATLLVGGISPDFKTEGGAATAAADDRPMRKIKNVAIFIHEGVELLDFSGPGEVFAAAGQGRAFSVYTVALKEDAITSQGFVRIKPQYTIFNCPPPDIVVLPGGNTRIPLNEPEVIEWIKNATQHAEVMLSVCTGAFLLAKAGLLDGREATTHWGSIERLRQAAPQARVRENRRFVDSGKIVTSAGVSAGIDGALHVVDRLLGRTAALETARYMEYNWQAETP